MQAAVDALVCGATDQHLAPGWEAHDCLCQAHQLTMILDLARDVMHLQTGSSTVLLPGTAASTRHSPGVEQCSEAGALPPPPPNW